jgi:hypothetical protein
VVITGVDAAGPFAEGVVGWMTEELAKHRTFAEREQGAVVPQEGDERQPLPLTRVEVRQVLPSDGPFYDIRSLTEALS